MPMNRISQDGQGLLQDVMGVVHRYRVTSEQSGGHQVCLDSTVAPGGGIPPHRHTREDETFIVLEGEVTFSGDGIPGPGTVLRRGGLVLGPRGQVHGFRNDGPVPARMLTVITPGTAMEEMFGKLSALPTHDPAAVAAICATYGITFTDPPART